MKKILMLLMLLFTAPVMAEEVSCYDNPDEEIIQLEKELKSCYQIHTDSPNTADLNEAGYRRGDCGIAVVYKIIDKYFSKNKEETKKHFDDLVKALYATAHDLSYGSDASRKINTGTMYVTSAITYGSASILEAAEDYLRVVRAECAEREEIAEDRRQALERGEPDPWEMF